MKITKNLKKAVALAQSDGIEWMTVDICGQTEYKTFYQVELDEIMNMKTGWSICMINRKIHSEGNKPYRTESKIGYKDLMKRYNK